MHIYRGNEVNVGGNFVPVADGSPETPKVWIGTQAQLDLVVGRDPNTLYVTTDGGTPVTVNTWRTGNGVPDNAVGIDGDLYLDDLTHEYYKRIAGVYVLQGDLDGADGADGAVGPAGGGFIANAWIPVWKVNGNIVAGSSGSTGWLSGNIFNFVAYKNIDTVDDGLVTIEGLPYASLLRCMCQVTLDGFVGVGSTSVYGHIGDSSNVIQVHYYNGGANNDVSGTFNNGSIIITGSIPVNIP